MPFPMIYSLLRSVSPLKIIGGGGGGGHHLHLLFCKSVANDPLLRTFMSMMDLLRNNKYTEKNNYGEELLELSKITMYTF